jgi:hypothetical protein
MGQPEMPTKALFLSLLITFSAWSNVMASPCGGDLPGRDELGQVIMRAAEQRPISITFLTQAEGVKLSPALALQYPYEMTIILQYQFRDLVVADARLEVGLEFKGIPERVVIPFDAITALHDPAVRKC